MLRHLDIGLKHATFHDFPPPTSKTMIFGLIIGVVVLQGMRVTGGTAGVGCRHQRRRLLALFIILADVVPVKWILVFFRGRPGSTTTALRSAAKVRRF